MPKLIVGYTDRMSVRPGERIQFHVSCDASVPFYAADIVRMVAGDIQPGGPGLKTVAIDTAINGNYRGCPREIHPGSYVEIERWPGVDASGGLSLAVTMYASLIGERERSLLSDLDTASRRGFSLLIDVGGRLCFRYGDGEAIHSVTLAVPVPALRWCNLVVIADPVTRSITVGLRRVRAGLEPEQRQLEKFALSGRGIATSSRSLLMAAAHGGIRPGDFFDGRLESPAIATGCLDQEELFALPERRAADRFYALWDFAIGIDTDVVTDLATRRLDGRLINLPLRAVRGSLWSGIHFDWTRAPAEYAAIHFLSDAIDDCGWPPDFALTVPDTLPSGFYAARLRHENDVDYIPFFVLPAHGVTKARILFLVPTMSYLAYANWRLPWENDASELMMSALPVIGDEDAYLIEHPEVGPSLYDQHSDGTSAIYASWRRPNLNLRPGHGWGEQYTADLYLTDWLEHLGVEFDVLTDFEVHRGGVAALAAYTCVLTGTHPEYQSTQEMDALDAYIAGGGRLLYLGGNGFCWRVAVHPTRDGIIEMRRGQAGSSIGRQLPGEFHLALTGELGGYWTDLGRPPARLVGVNFVSQGFDFSAHYRRCPDSHDPRAAFIFAGLDKDSVIGDFGLLGNGAAGLEIDRYDAFGGTPAQALRLATSEGNHTATFVPARNADPVVRSDLVYIPVPGGGAVFSVGSMSWAAALSHENFRNPVARITENVLRAFSDPHWQP
jgi:N,N-dimethylformamidase